MSNSPRQPRPDDAVLGGQYQAPIDGAVLGGIEGVRQRLATDNLEVKKVTLTQALNYGEKGVEVLFEVLEKEKNLDIYWFAYHILEKQINIAIQARLKNYFLYYEFESITVNRWGEIIKRTLGKAKYFREDLGNGIYLDMTYIPGGRFLMGAPKSEEGSSKDERPQHQVTIPPFWMGKYTVTQEQWQAIMGNNPSCFQDNTNNPVEQVSWHDTKVFCQKLKKLTGKDFRLPTEAEWEYACRAGTTSPFHCGEMITTDLANYNGIKFFTAQGEQIYRGKTVVVGTFPPNDFGLYEMHGNVREWCEDNWHDSYYKKPDNLKLNGSITWSFSKGNKYVLRGGSWLLSPLHCGSAFRGRNHADDGLDSYGFRLALSIS